MKIFYRPQFYLQIIFSDQDQAKVPLIGLPLLLENALDMLLKDTDLTSGHIKSESDFTQITVRFRNMTAIGDQVTQVSKYREVPPSQIVRDNIRATKWRDTARDRIVEKTQLEGLLDDKEALGESCHKNEIPQSAGNQQESKQLEIASESGSSPGVKP